MQFERKHDLVGRSFSTALTLLMLFVLLAGCMSSPPQPSLPTESVPLTAPTSTPTVEPTLTPDFTPTSEITSTTPPAEETQAARQKAARLASGWTIYSNPDFVNGIVVHDGTLWAATTGGVTAWDLRRDTHKLFTTRDGLTEIQGNDIVYCPMPEERILVGHETDMLSAYDLKQKRWSRIPITFNDGSTMSGIQAMRCDAANKRLLIGSAEGLGILDFATDTWRHIGPDQGLNVSEITAIDVAGQAIWVAAGEESAFLVTGNTIFPFSGASGFPYGPVFDLSVSPDSTIWFSYPTSLVRYFDGKWLSYGGNARTGIPFLSMDHVEAAGNKTIWIAGAEEGVCPFDVASYACSTLYVAPKDAPITDLVLDEAGVGYAATYGRGIMVLDGEQMRWLTIDEKRLISNDVRDIAESQDGRLWIATDRGVNIFDPAHPDDPWQVIGPERNGLVSGLVSGLQPVENGMWIFYDQKPQASYYDGATWTQMEPGKGVASEVLDAAVDSRGYLWFATRTGIDIWDGSVMRSYGPDTGLPASTYHALLPDSEGMWVGTEHGLLRYARFQWSTLLPDFPVNSILSGENGDLLLGADHGLVRFDGRESYLWIINLGDQIVINPKVTSLTRDKNNTLWVGTEEDGLFMYDGKTWEQFNTARGLPTNFIRKVYTDRSGAIWIIASTGKSGGALVRFIP